MNSTDLLLLSGIALVSFILSVMGVSVGLVLGHFRLPLLVAYLGSAPAGAATNLAVSGLGAGAGSFRHLREGRVSLSMKGLRYNPYMEAEGVRRYDCSRRREPTDR